MTGQPRFESDAVLAEHLKLVHADVDGLPIDGGAHVYAVFGPVPLPVGLQNGRSATFQWTTFRRIAPSLLKGHASDHFDGTVAKRALLKHLSQAKEWPQSILTFGAFAEEDSPLVRIHSNCATGDVFGSQRCECGPQLHSAMEQIIASGSGALIYMADHEGRGIGLFAKAAAYLLQDRGFDTYEANRLLGYEEDERDFRDAAFILNHLRGARRLIKLLTNNPDKVQSLEGMGFLDIEVIPLVTGITQNNIRYLRAKRRYGHILPEDLLGQGQGAPLKAVP